MSKSSAIIVVAVAALVCLALPLLLGPVGASADITLNTVKVSTRHVAEDSCSRLRVVNYRGGLDGSTYECAGGV